MEYLHHILVIVSSQCVNWGLPFSLGFKKIRGYCAVRPACSGLNITTGNGFIGG